ncbi:MAG TPA: hypothetical protein IAA30_06855 [Candidatus Treponema faecavium]|nr:hypothetical protein [Candidatus Treponema faecavium]
MAVTKKMLKKQESEKRVAELQKKIYDKRYIDDAVQRIAFVLSRTLTSSTTVN